MFDGQGVRGDGDGLLVEDKKEGLVEGSGDELAAESWRQREEKIEREKWKAREYPFA